MEETLCKKVNQLSKRAEPFSGTLGSRVNLETNDIENKSSLVRHAASAGPSKRLLGVQLRV